MEYYYLNENHVSWLDINFKIYWVPKSTPAANLKILLTFQGHKNLHEQNFWNWSFFYLKRQGYVDITMKMNLVVTSSHINLAMRLLIKSNLTEQK